MHECLLGLQVTSSVVGVQRRLVNDIRTHALFAFEGHIRVQRLIGDLELLDWDLDGDLFNKMNWLPRPVELGRVLTSEVIAQMRHLDHWHFSVALACIDSGLALPQFDAVSGGVDAGLASLYHCEPVELGAPVSSDVEARLTRLDAVAEECLSSDGRKWDAAQAPNGDPIGLVFRESLRRLLWHFNDSVGPSTRGT